jgi:hypothetical protein
MVAIRVRGGRTITARYGAATRPSPEPTAIQTYCRRKAAASFWISGAKVAEKRKVCRRSCD